jgi:hypothetical protein
MRHMVRLYIDGLPPDLFHQRRRSSTDQASGVCAPPLGSLVK